MENFNELRKTYGEFIYQGYEIDEIGFSFHFSIGEFNFYPEWKWNGCFDKALLHNKLIEYIVFSIGMAELVSYWKCACPPVVTVKCGRLDDRQIKWWKKLYFNGLGEFFYRNGIETDIDSFMDICRMETSMLQYARARRQAERRSRPRRRRKGQRCYSRTAQRNEGG